MKNIIITINTTKYEVSEDIAKSITTICQSMGKKVTVKAETTVESTTTEERKPFYTVNGKTVKLGGDGQYIPKKVFYAITCSLKESGAKWDTANKVWNFETKAKATEWDKAQKNRNK